jgi:hypothetical protein
MAELRVPIPAGTTGPHDCSCQLDAGAAPGSRLRCECRPTAERPRMSDREWHAFMDQHIAASRRMTALDDGLHPGHAAVDMQIQDLAARDGCSYVEAFDRVVDHLEPEAPVLRFYEREED